MVSKRVWSSGENHSRFFRGTQKRGSEKYYIIISLILGLIVLTLSLFWIFNSYFTEDELDWQQCRQSIILRSSLPEADLFLLKTDTKGAFPLKCRTEVVMIDSAENPEEVYEKISDAVAEGWYMFGEGKFDFVHRDAWKDETLCMVFARVHYDADVVGSFVKEDQKNWEDYFKDKYGAMAEVYPLDIERQFGFESYYRSSNVGNSGETYDEYLPLIEESPSRYGNLLVGWDNVEFSPESDEDYLLVYRINSVKGITDSTLGKFLISFTPPLLSEVIWSDEYAKAWTEWKTIAIVSVGDLDVLGCDKFLTIPA